MSVKKTVCLVTGASSGIGHAIAQYLQQQPNTEVIVTARRKERLEALAAHHTTIIPGDITEPAFQDNLISYIWERYGYCDYLFNCAGNIETGTIEEINIDRVTAMLRLNIEATFRLTYAILKKFKEQEYGHIVNLSSVLGTKVRATAGAYAASKYAIEALSEALRMELTNSAIKITCIEPGLVMTELHNSWEVHPKDSMNIPHPLSTADIVAVVKFIMEQPAHVNIPKLMILPKGHNI
ncbi:SDR family oxidoreductase [Chitinophaga sp. Cy-1792]|uniref:SDR family oxidoreductase n=1 Tax=Chitinophaga sp. Cy-1792 TaxID=2608339 RepID=UPI00141F28E8|nr:SDR family oxidoreductase [Chitinophaga sp. Cy-1792]NIG54080.1 SDR family oxidoreductase [Chitinophaga sp. Cy-1792]